MVPGTAGAPLEQPQGSHIAGASNGRISFSNVPDGSRAYPSITPGAPPGFRNRSRDPALQPAESASREETEEGRGATRSPTPEARKASRLTNDAPEGSGTVGIP